MTASLSWTPVSMHSHDFASGSRYHTQLSNAFGHFPLRLNGTNRAVLVGMAAIDDAYERLLEAIDTWGEIEITVEY